VKGRATYIFQVHLDGWIYRGARVLDHSHPPGLCVCEEGRGLFKLRLLTAPFQKKIDDFVAQIISANFGGIGSCEVIGLFVDFLTESSHSILASA